MKQNVLTLMKTVVFMWIVTLIFMLFMAFIVYKMEGEDTGIQVCVYIIYGLVNFAGGFIFGGMIGRKKYLFGMIAGGIYFFSLLVVSVIMYGAVHPVKEVVWTLICCIVCGMVGGMCSRSQ